jgi:hypothetical protein
MVAVTAQVNPPPATAVVPATIRSEFAVTDWSIATVKLFAYTSSPEAGRVPPFHVAVFDQLPFATAQRSATVASYE